ncbi:hypothetical protein ACVI1J_007618 [Bradyrhizobium diazoefficiens]
MNQGLHAVQQQDARKNYIGLVNDTSEDKRLADSAARSQPRVMSYLVPRSGAETPWQGHPRTRDQVLKATTPSNPPELGDETLSQ